ncbi:gliding motility-associated C-terminal domain-containing protein, partial [Chitinophaga sp.]|uniref:gliding motility-associated C-terminal domain-containing protein n=1 Tax=Chitinophaga sp. TaxID=1869181 RepID=UPI002F94BA9C
TVVPVPSAPGISLVKTGALSTDGSSITYTFTLRNTGNVTLSNLVLNDAKLGMSNEPVPGTLVPGGSTTFTRTYTLTQADINAGSVTNTANTTGQTPGGGTVTDTSGTTGDNNTPTVVPVPSAPGITLVKAGVVSTDGITITYTFTIRNTGNVALSNLTLTDAKLGMVDEAIPGSLAPGGSTTFTRTYTLTSADINTGSVTNTATVTGQTPDGRRTTDVSGTREDNDTPTLTPVPALELLIPNVITPNGDGMNDRFVIKGLQRYPGSGIYIYNRWGNMVYQNKNYDNTWDGNGLNEGTYYYILKLNTPQGEKVHKGWIELLR